MLRARIWPAAAVVLITNLLIGIKVIYNRTGEVVSDVELSWQELELVRRTEDNPALALRLRWKPGNRLSGEERLEWLGKEKLEELGFDCRLNLSDPRERKRIAAMPPRQAYAVLKLIAPEGAAGEPGAGRLWLTDVARRAEELEQRYPDPQERLILRCLVRAEVITRLREAGPGAGEPEFFWRGYVAHLPGDEITIPPAFRGLYLRENGAQTEDRIVTRVRTGRNHEPWLESARRQPQ